MAKQKITEFKLVELSRLRGLGFSQGEIAKKLKVSQRLVSTYLMRLKEQSL